MCCERDGEVRCGSGVRIVAGCRQFSSTIVAGRSGLCSFAGSSRASAAAAFDAADCYDHGITLGRC